MLIEQMVPLFLAMLVLAIIPGPAVCTVVGKSLSSGFSAGLAITAGIVLGDYVFIAIALFGLSALAELMGQAFVVVKYISALYLLWFGIRIFNSKLDSDKSVEKTNKAMATNIVTGLLITLSNPKAILFYVGFFPAFVDLGEVTTLGILSIMLLATTAFGSVNAFYAAFAAKAKNVLLTKTFAGYVRKLAGSMMFVSGIWVAVKE